MSDRVSGTAGRSRLVARTLFLLGAIGLVAGPLAPLTAAAGGVSATTPFPAIVSEPGSTASFKVTLSTTQAGEVGLKAGGVPAGWTARFHGGGFVIDSAYVTPGKPVDVTFDVEVPADQAATTAQIRVVATGAGGADTLPLTLRVTDAAAGDVTLTSDFPELKGPSTATFAFNLTLKNGTPGEITFAIDATGPDGWDVTAKPSGSAQATSTVVAAGGSTTIAVTAKPSSDVAAGTYPIVAKATGGGKVATAEMKVTITGTYTLTVSTPDQVLSASANAGTQKDITLTLANSGTAAITNVALSASAPTGWKVVFNPPTVPSVDAGQTQTVTAQVTPTTDAIAGDYEVTITAKGAEASDNVTLRIRVETPQIWWIAGIVLIVAVFAGLYWVFRTYGRR
jgi:uncharacterized membrane protein